MPNPYELKNEKRGQTENVLADRFSGNQESVFDARKQQEHSLPFSPAEIDEKKAEWRAYLVSKEKKDTLDVIDMSLYAKFKEQEEREAAFNAQPVWIRLAALVRDTIKGERREDNEELFYS